MRLFVNGLAASAGGGLTYIRNVIPPLSDTPGLQVLVALPSGLAGELRDYTNVEFAEMQVPLARRFWFEQSVLPGVIQRAGCDVLLSTGNFALRRSPVPQILLSRNSIYTSNDFYRDLRSRGEYRLWLDTQARAFLAKRSVYWADVTVAPSSAFAADLRRWTGVNVRAIHHGFDREAFSRDATPLAECVEEKLRSTQDSLKLLFVSHYNYYRNFETLLRALPLFRQKLPGRSVKLLLTCKLKPGDNPGSYNPASAAALVKDLGLSDIIVELGTVRYHQLHQLYRRADLYVTPAYTETFAHPLVEAMACGLPVIASDLPVHREICEDAATYFPRFSFQALAESILQAAESSELRKRMTETGLKRSLQFSWKRHVEEIVELADGLIHSKPIGQQRGNCLGRSVA